jgi:hypothetical protein
LRPDFRPVGWLYWGLMAGLVLVVVLGVVREHRASVLSASIDPGIPAEFKFAKTLEITRRVAARFRFIDEHGPVGIAAPWPFRTDADNLLTTGDCGRAAGALAAVLLSRGQAFRIVQVNLDADGANHIMVEVQDDTRRWVLVDPSEGRGFARPRDGRYLGIEEIRALPPGERAWLPEKYRDGDYSLFTPYRRTNWARLGPLADVVRAVKGEAWMHETSLRAVMLETDRRLTEVAAASILLLAIARVLAARTARGRR